MYQGCQAPPVRPYAPYNLQYHRVGHIMAHVREVSTSVISAHMPRCTYDIGRYPPLLPRAEREHLFSTHALRLFPERLFSASGERSRARYRFPQKAFPLWGGGVGFRGGVPLNATTTLPKMCVIHLI